MQTDDVVVRVQVQDGTWEMLGADRAVQVVPESLTLSASVYGSDTASFDLRRDPTVLWPDLAAFTPIEVEIGGEVVWAGRLKETPGRDGDDPVVNVQAEGWQYHLDDDVYIKNYVHSTIPEWRDGRSFPDANLANWTASPTISTDNGTVMIAFPKSQVAVVSTFAGIVLDLGPSSTAASISVDWQSSNNSNGGTLYARSAASVAALTGASVSDAFSFLNNAGASGTTRGTFGTPGRYVSLFMFNNTGLDYSPGGDVWFKLTGIRVFSNDAWRSTDASILHASDVIKDALTQATSKLSADTTRVATTSFAIPDFHFPVDPKTPREVTDGVNALHNYITQVDVNKRMVFQPRPVAPLFEAGTWPGATFEDSSMNSGQDMYNRVLVTGTGPDGTAMVVSRTAAIQSGSSRVRGQVSATWSAGGSTTPTDNFGSLLTPIYAGTPIFVTATVTGASGAQTVTVMVGNTSSSFSGNGDTASFSFPTTNGTYTLMWLPGKDHTDVLEVKVTLNSTSGTAGTVVIDGYKGTTVLDRRGLQRTKVLPINASLTTAVANQIGDTYLAAHKTQPLTGTLTVTPGGVRHALTGETIPPALLLANTGQLVRLGHRINPDDGSVGRDGTIAAVSYTHDTREASVSIDNTRNNFEALLQRFAVLSGGSAI